MLVQSYMVYFLIEEFIKEYKILKIYFINQILFLLSTHLSTDDVQEEINILEDKYRFEMEYHYNLKEISKKSGSFEDGKKQ